jgi:hypothetical protein
MPSIRSILGESPDTPVRYYVRFAGKLSAYCHCEWMELADIEQSPQGDSALVRYRTKCKRYRLTASLSISGLLTFSGDYVDPLWWEVDRVIDHNSSGETRKYLVKWKNQEYSESTWEEEGILSEAAIRDYERRRGSSNPKRIPSRWVHPSDSAFVPIEEPPEPKFGEVLRSYQLMVSIGFD